MPAARSPAQIEASRRNGARSRGPVSEEGKARASRNALKHGLNATEHLVLEDEVPDALEALIERMTEETGAETEIEARLARRLAIAFWKCERADKIETALFDAAPRTRPNGYRQEAADPLTTFDVRRFNAVRGYQAQQGREISRCLKELRQLRKDARAECTGEPEATLENEPGIPPAANDDAASARASTVKNEPGPPADGLEGCGLTDATRAELNRLLAVDDWSGLARLEATGALRPMGLEPLDLASPEALRRAISRFMRRPKAA